MPYLASEANLVMNVRQLQKDGIEIGSGIEYMHSNTSILKPAELLISKTSIALILNMQSKLNLR